MQWMLSRSWRERRVKINEFVWILKFKQNTKPGTKKRFKICQHYTWNTEQEITFYLAVKILFLSVPGDKADVG